MQSTSRRGARRATIRRTARALDSAAPRPGVSPAGPRCLALTIATLLAPRAHAQVATPPAGPAPAVTPLTTADSTLPRARGFWRAEGYATVLAITSRAVRAYRTAGPACWPDPRPDAGRADYAYVAPASGPGTLTLLTWPGDTRYQFRRLARLPAACRAAEAGAVAWSSPRVLQAFTDLVGEQYAFFGPRGVDWPTRARAAHRRVTPATDAAGLYAAMTTALAGVGDPHVELHAVVGGDTVVFKDEASPTLAAVAAGARAGEAPEAAERRWRAAYRAGILDSLLAGRGHLDANRRIFWGTIPGQAGGRGGGRVGYLNVVTMGGFTAGGEDADPGAELAALDSVLDRAVGSFRGARAVIVDVTNNRGGYDVISRAIAARFADRPRRVYTKHARGAAGVPPQPFVLTPAAGPRYLGPVTLVTSDVTVSAGETFALAMRALPAVRHVGTRTRGAFSDVLAVPLPNGWRVHLSNEVYRDPRGHGVEGVGLVPAEPIDVFPAADLAAGTTMGHVHAVRTLAARLAAPRAR